MCIVGVLQYRNTAPQVLPETSKLAISLLLP